MISKTKRGDTLVEVAIAIGVFGLISVITVGIMNNSYAAIQATLELEMARNEIDAQAEAIRFIHNSYLSERELINSQRVYQKLWLELSRGTTEVVATYGEAGRGLSNNPAAISTYPASSCEVYYTGPDNDLNVANDEHNIWSDNAFVINTRKIDPTSAGVADTIVRSKSSSGNRDDIFTTAPLFPRLVFTNSGHVGDTDYEMQGGDEYNVVARAEGVWVIAARDATKSSADGVAFTERTELNEISVPEFYDFHIRTCWYNPGRGTPTTIATVIRLYNPEYAEDTR